MVTPRGKGLCPRCSRTLKGSFLARRHPVNLLRRDQLLAKFVREYSPDTQRLQSLCEQLAGVTEQLEVLKPGGAEHQRLVQLGLTIGAALEESRSNARRVPDADYDALSDDAMIARLEATLAEAKARREEKREGERYLAAAAAARDDATPLQPTDDAAIGREPMPVVQPTCQYCQQSTERCAEIKATRLDAWRTMHAGDPEEVARREREATKVMLLTMPHGSGITTW